MRPEFFPFEKKPSVIERPITKIVILMAMQDEADPIIKELKLNPCEIGLDHRLNLHTFKGTLQEQNTAAEFELVLVAQGFCRRFTECPVSQVGTQAATRATMEICNKLEPQLIITAGTAGGYPLKGAQVGDVFVSTDQISYHNRDIPLPGYEAYGKGNYECLEIPSVTSELNLKSSIISTGDSLRPSDRDEIMIAENKAIIKDMEAAAVAETALLFGVSVLAVKSVTNQIGLYNDFKPNFQIAIKNLAEKIPEILKRIINKKPSELLIPSTSVETYKMAINQ